MNVLSLFDGISCGMVALERAGIAVDNYVSFEIDKSAINISKSNYPNIKQCGSVIGANFAEYKGHDLLIGGSPCQDLCGMGSRKGLQGEKSRLFFEFVRALETINPRYFLLENNASMSAENKKIISEIMGCEPLLIDSADYSAQHRKRLYWTNIPIIPHIAQHYNLSDIFEYNKKHECVDDYVGKYVLSGAYKGRKIEKTVRGAIRELYQQSRTLGTGCYQLGSNTGLIIKVDSHYYRPLRNEYERLQTLPDNYTSCVDIKKACKAIGNGWTVDVIAHIFRGII